MAGDFGRKLREARERRGLSLRQISAKTKISVTALEALERNDISRLPGGIFSRAFVRSYALEVGLDPETTILEFIAQFPSDSVTAGHPTSGRVEDEEEVESERQLASTLLRLVVVSVPIAIAVVYFGTAGRRFMTRERPSAAPPVQSASDPPVAPPPGAPAPPADTPAATDSAAKPPDDQAAPKPDPAVAPAPAPEAADRFTVALTVTRPCWISATVDGEKKIERLLQPGEDQTLQVGRELVLTAGDAAAVALTLNGAEAKPLGRSGEVVTRRLNAANYKDYLQSR